jgi:cytochrome P450
LAGTETTAIVLTMLVYILTQHPEFMAKAREEVLSSLGDKDYLDID